MGFDKPIIVDARGHLLGRAASQVAKQLLNGQKVVVVRCEQIECSGTQVRAEMKYHRFLKKKMLTNPKKGPIHYKSPARIFWRTVRGMVPHKTMRGAQAMQRLKVYEGIPAPFDQMKRQVMPDCLRIVRLKPGRPYCGLGDISRAFGWKHGDLVESLEVTRKAKSDVYYKAKKEDNKNAAAAMAKANAALGAGEKATLAAYGF